MVSQTVNEVKPFDIVASRLTILQLARWKLLCCSFTSEVAFCYCNHLKNKSLGKLDLKLWDTHSHGHCSWHKQLSECPVWSKHESLKNGKHRKAQWNAYCNGNTTNNILYMNSLLFHTPLLQQVAAGLSKALPCPFATWRVTIRPEQVEVCEEFFESNPFSIFQHVSPCSPQTRLHSLR